MAWAVAVLSWWVCVFAGVGLVAALLGATACSSRVRGGAAPVELSGEMFCLTVKVRHAGQVQTVVGCTPSRSLCARACNTARSRGSLVGVVAVGSCHEVRR